MRDRWLTHAVHVGFGLFLLLLLISRAAPPQGGLFGWLPLPLPGVWSGYDWRIGVLSLLPLLVLGLWLLEQWRRDAPRWRWGPTAVTLPLALFSLLVLIRLNGEMAHYAAMLGLCWFVYLFLVNRPAFRRHTLFWVLALALIVQGAVALVQFLGQRELGLYWLGEPVLYPAREGTSVVQRGTDHWLRAYGLNSHPNQLGLLLTALCLLLWRWRPLTVEETAVSIARRWLFWLALALGLAGLLVSLSRSAWLALLVGGFVYVIYATVLGKPPFRRRAIILPLAVLAAGLLLFGLVYGDVLAGRFLDLDSPLESRSLWERRRDAALALNLLAAHMETGVGLGQYQIAAAQINPDAAVVHNVPLLVGAELGWPGLLLWLAWWLAPLVVYGRNLRQSTAVAVWLSLITMAFVQPEPTLFLPKGTLLWGLAAAAWMPEPTNRRRERSVS